jgi:hypothetical protein
MILRGGILDQGIGYSYLKRKREYANEGRMSSTETHGVGSLWKVGGRDTIIGLKLKFILVVPSGHN